MNTMSYKGQTARLEFDDRDNIFVGHILGIADVIGLHADTVQALRAAFEEAVDDYIETCAKIGKEPQKPASPSLSLFSPFSPKPAANPDGYWAALEK